MIYFIPTPIGNLEDISHRSLKTLMRIENIFCEDTRLTKKLLSLLEEKFNLPNTKKHFTSFHSHNEKEILLKLDIKELKQNDYAFVSDAGMPSISDPGASLVKFCQENDIKYEIFPGANALLLAYVASGFSQTEFSFFGFLPHKGNERKNKLQEVLNHCLNTIIYESPHRILTLLNEIALIDNSREIFAIKEATKKHEKCFFGISSEVLEEIKNSNIRGEWVVVIKAKQNPLKTSPLGIDDILNLSLKPKEKSKLLAKITGQKTEFWYKKLTS